MKKFDKILVGIFAAATALFCMSTGVWAATVSATADKDTAVIGDTYTVTVDVVNEDGAAVAPEVSVNYDANRLGFESCSSEYGGGAGGLITLSEGTSNIVFNVLSGGQATVDVTAIFDGDGANAQTASASLMVEGDDIAGINENSTEETLSGVEAGSIVSSDGTKIVSTVFANEFMPVGFYKTTVSYEEQMVEAAQFDMGNIVLLYVTDADGNNGNFDIYDQSTGELSDFLQISGIENRFIIALKAPEDAEIPQGFTKASLQWNAQMLEAYTYVGETSEDAPIPVSDFFLIYAISSEGNTGWYMYDQNEGTYQRFLEGLHGSSAIASTESIISQIATPVTKAEGEEKGKVNILFIVAVSLAVLLIILIITVIVMAVKLREFNSYEYIDEDDEYEGNTFLNEASKNTMSREIPGKSESDTTDNPTDVTEKMNSDNGTFDKTPKFVMSLDNEDSEGEAKKPKDDVAEGTPENVKKDVSEEFVIRKNKQISEREAYERDSYGDEEESLYDDGDMFSPRDMKRSRADKKAAKQEEKARKKAEKQMKKEFGEFGPVDWQSWQDAVEGGEKTAAMAARNAGTEGVVPSEIAKAPKAEARVDSQAMRRAPEELEYNKPASRPSIESRKEAPFEPVRDLGGVKKVQSDRIEKSGREEAYAEPTRKKDNPMDMMKKIPANDNKAPVQARPVQQFDFDDDFEFEFLNLDDED